MIARNCIYLPIVLVTLIIHIHSPHAEVHQSEQSPSKLTFVYLRSQDHAVTQWLILIYREAFRRLDIQFEFKDIPAKRASIYANSGLVDGELSRVYDYNSVYSNLVRVEEHNYYVRFSAFSANPLPRITGWDNLAGKNYRVVYVKGVKRCAEILPQYIPSDHLESVNEISQGIKMVLGGRADIFIGVEGRIVENMKSMKQTIHKVGLMEQTTGHAWLYKKHASLAPLLSKVLFQMKEEGLYKIYGQRVGIDPDAIMW